MANYVFSRKAIEDLTNIWEYTYEVWSENQADAYYKLLIEACEVIAEKPANGKIYKEISDDLLGYKIGRHIIFYRKV
ncbi:MAG: type II toxin-antitoxin system RelE/ParE family toxin, partial [Cytophagales bacterium]|nr:type II toxin-antitoxin system RelE/ParE family toxin [Cytophagales bacterium]